MQSTDKGHIDTFVKNRMGQCDLLCGSEQNVQLKERHLVPISMMYS